MCGEGDEICGRHSGIPPCCREWYIKVWGPLNTVAHKNEKLWNDISNRWKERHQIQLIYPERGVQLAHYVRCPGCKHCNVYIKIKPCPSSILERSETSLETEGSGGTLDVTSLVRPSVTATMIVVSVPNPPD